MTFSWEKEPVFCFTSDIDWASDSIIKYSHDIISGNDLKLTYFVTHPSLFLKNLYDQKKVRLLIHPNFLPNSSHGNSFKEVINYCLNLVPNADGFRSHRYFEVNDIMDDLEKLGFKFVSNHCTRCETNIKPLIHRSGLLSIPIFLEDGGYLLMDPTLNFKNLIPKLKSPGLKVINFHPAHIAFNTPDFAYTRSIKDSISRESWNNLSLSDLLNLENKDKPGIRDIVKGIIDFTFGNDYKILSMHEIYQEHQSNNDMK
jgi:hypothetical protein